MRNKKYQQNAKPQIPLTKPMPTVDCYSNQTYKNTTKKEKLKNTVRLMRFLLYKYKKN